MDKVAGRSGRGGAAVGELGRRGDGRDAAAGEHVAEERSHLLVDEAVGGEDLARVERELRAVEVADAAAGFFDEQVAGGGVPGVQVELPEGFKAAGGDVGEVDSRRAGAADAVRAQRELLVEMDVRVLVALVAGK